MAVGTNGADAVGRFGWAWHCRLCLVSRRRSKAAQTLKGKRMSYERLSLAALGIILISLPAYGWHDAVERYYFPLQSDHGVLIIDVDLGINLMNGQHMCLDTGATETFITEAAVKQLDIEGMAGTFPQLPPAYVTLADGSLQKRQRVNLKMILVWAHFTHGGDQLPNDGLVPYPVSNIPAVVVPSAPTGTIGCLGLNWLQSWQQYRPRTSGTWGAISGTYALDPVKPELVFTLHWNMPH
jgi:hypothetical protein